MSWLEGAVVLSIGPDPDPNHRREARVTYQHPRYGIGHIWLSRLTAAERVDLGFDLAPVRPREAAGGGRRKAPITGADDV